MSMRKLLVVAAVLLIIASAVPTTATAELITVRFGGVVRSLSLTLPPSLTDVIRAGDPVTGFFTIDTAHSDTDPASTLGVYRYTEPQYKMRAVVGDAFIKSSVTAPNLTVQIMDDHVLGIAPDGMDRFGVMSFANSVLSPSNIAPAQFHFFLSDLTKTAFDSDKMPVFPLDLKSFGSTQFAQGQIATSGGQPDQIFINFTIDEMAVVDAGFVNTQILSWGSVKGSYGH